MNLIMMQNMSAIMMQTPAPPKLKRGGRLHERSKSKDIILYLLENGKTSGSDIMRALGMKSSPKSYIQPHIKAGRVICQGINIHKILYEIAEGLGPADFGLKE